MATYAIGDIQGCMASLQALLDEIARHGFRLGRDHLWLTGDLVNRGPRSLDVLRWAHHHRAGLTTVLGNHDVHALLRFAGHAKEKKRDTLDEVLAAPDAAELFEWLRQQPFLAQRSIAQRRFVMVHAGLAPTWSLDEAAARAGELASLLTAPSWQADSKRLVGKGGPWRASLRDDERLRSMLLYFTRVRSLTRATGEPDPEFDGELADMPKANEAWFAMPRAAWRTTATSSAPTRVVFGHWAALGVTTSPYHLSLDSGCVWGRRLTAVRLDDDATFSVDACD